jgi:hypothetical protein
MTTSRRSVYRYVMRVLPLLFVLVMTVPHPLHAQLQTLVVGGSTAIKGEKPGHDNALLYLLDVHFVNRSNDNGLVKTDVVQTDRKGNYTITVFPGSLDIHVIGIVNAESNGRSQVWLEGHLEGFRISPSQAGLSLPTIQLTRVRVTRADLTGGNGQTALNRRVELGDLVHVSILDPYGLRLSGTSARAIGSKTGVGTESTVILGEQGVNLITATDGVRFVHIQTPGFNFWHWRARH